MNPTIQLETNHLLLESTREDWLDRVIEIERTYPRFIGQSTREQHLQYIHIASEIHLTILQKADRKIIGYYLLFDTNSPHRSILIKRIAIAGKGKGYGRESLRAIKKYCFEILKCHRLWLDVYPYNERAIYLYESEGFQIEGLLRESILLDGVFQSQLLMSILEREYVSTKMSD